jgi:hypothetical protein
MDTKKITRVSTAQRVPTLRYLAKTLNIKRRSRMDKDILISSVNLHLGWLNDDELAASLIDEADWQTSRTRIAR